MSLFGQRILILVPHPDDEVVACGVAIERAQKEGAALFALYLTHGCIARETLWPWQRKKYESYVARRRIEAEKAAALLNITPVGWATRPARAVMNDLDAVYAEIRAAIESHAITQLWIPAFEGGNADHDAINAVATTFLPSLTNVPSTKAQNLSILEFAEYNFHGGQSHSHTFPAPNGTETILSLSPEEQRKKQNALALYESEKRNLNYVKTIQESFRPIAAYDYSRKPHEGTLWYARFQWVPFRHPRVDFTDPQELATKLAAWLKRKT